MSYYTQNQGQAGYDTYAYSHPAYAQQPASTAQAQYQGQYEAQYQGYAQNGSSSSTSHGSSTSAATAAYYQQHQLTAAPKDGSGRKAKRKNPATLLEVEKQWAAAAGASSQREARYQVEPNFTAFTLAGGRSYLEDGSGTPSPMNSATGKGT